MINPPSPTPAPRATRGEEFLYLKLVKDIKNGILTGVYPKGSQIPSYTELAKAYNIHRLTVRRALQELKREGLVYAIPAKGVYVGDGRMQHSNRSRGPHGETWSVGIVPDIVEPALFGFFHFEIIEDMRRLLHLDLHSLQILPPRGGTSTDSWLANLKRADLTALVLIGRPMELAVMHDLAKIKPLILLDPQPPIESLTAVVIADEQGGYQAGKHLLSLGHTDIGLIVASHQTSSNKRMAGFKRAIAESGIGNVRLRTFEGNYSSISGSKAAEQIMRETHRPTALFCLNDEMALGAMQALSSAGIHVPNDISIMGYDDVRMCTVSNPPLTTVRISTADIARVTVDAIQHKLSGTQSNEMQYVLMPKLIVRASTGPVRK